MQNNVSGNIVEESCQRNKEGGVFGKMTGGLAYCFPCLREIISSSMASSFSGDSSDGTFWATPQISSMPFMNCSFSTRFGEVSPNLEFIRTRNIFSSQSPLLPCRRRYRGTKPRISASSMAGWLKIFCKGRRTGFCSLMKGTSKWGGAPEGKESPIGEHKTNQESPHRKIGTLKVFTAGSG